MITAEELLERERKYKLNDKEINGFQFWQYERFHIYSSLRALGQCDEHTNNKKVWRKLLKYYVRNGRHLKKRKSVDICFVPHPRRILNDGVYECIYTDDIASKFSNSIMLERFYDMQHLEPIKSSNVLYLDRTVIGANIQFLLIKKILKKHFKRVKQQIFIELQIALEGIATNEQVQKFTLHAVQDYYLYQYYRRSYRKMLLQLKPKLVVEVVSYSMHCMVINEICKELGITTIEFQHGYIERNHIAYNYISDSMIRQFPDKLYLFGNYYKRGIRYPITQDNLITVGFPYFEREMKRHQVLEREDGRYTIVFLSQGKWTPLLSRVAVDLQERMRGENVRVLYKLHPFEYETWRQIHPELENSGIEVVGTGEMTLYDCLAVSDAQVGVYSTTILEGLGFGLRTFIYNQREAAYMQNLLKMGVAELINSAQELVEKIKQKNEGKYDIDYFWRKDAMKNMEQALVNELEIVRKNGKHE